MLSHSTEISCRNPHKEVPGKEIFKLKNLFIPINTNNTHWTLVVIYFEEKRIKYYDSIANDTGNSQLNNILQFLMDSEEERKYTGDDFKWDLVVSTACVPKQENRFDCSAFICMYCHYLSNDSTLDFDQTAIAPFQKRIALQILSGTEYTSLDELSDSLTLEVIVLNDGKDKVSNIVSQNSTVRPHQEILSSTTNGDDFYVAKFNKKLHDKILEVLESFGHIQNSQEFKFNYYHTTSNDTTEPEVKVFPVAKGLLARLNPQDSISKNEFPSNKWIPYSIKYIS
jgi:hypothetical protein